MSEKKERISVSEAVRLNVRGLRLFCKERPGMIFACTVNNVATALAPYVPIWFSARVISELTGERDPKILWTWVILTLAALVVSQLALGVIKRWNNAYLNGRYPMQEHVLAEKFVKMDYAVMDDQKTWDLYSQIRQNANWGGWGFLRTYESYRGFLNGIAGIAGAVALTWSLFAAPVTGTFAFLGDGLAVVIAVAAILGVTMLTGWLRSRSEKMWADAADLMKLGNRYFIYYCMTMLGRGSGDARFYQQDRIVDRNLNGGFYQLYKEVFRPIVLGRGTWLMAASVVVMVLLQGLVYLFVGLKAWSGAFDVGKVTQYVAAITMVSESVAQLIFAFGNIRLNVPFLRATFAFLDLPNTMYKGSLTTEKRDDRLYEVEFRNVSFKYPGSDQYALKNVSMKFQVGRKLAIVGENGSGKTTFIKLLCRLYDPDEGEILLNGIDIRKYAGSDYRDIFSVVFQDFQLISQPLGANVAGAREYDRARAELALRAAGFGERLDAMPEGLDTWLYKDLRSEGVTVSGGEAQKIAIARALYKDAPFIILDEPTAALDPIAEAEVYARFNDISGDRTAIYISHRLSSCRFCDEILVFAGGQIVQRGSHDQLAEVDGEYRTLWEAQAQYYKES